MGKKFGAAFNLEFVREAAEADHMESVDNRQSS